jgi:hypothetical protein
MACAISTTIEERRPAQVLQAEKGEPRVDATTHKSNDGKKDGLEKVSVFDKKGNKLADLPARLPKASIMINAKTITRTVGSQAEMKSKSDV